MLQPSIKHWPHTVQKIVIFQWQMKQFFNTKASAEKYIFDLFRVKMYGIAVMKCKADRLKLRGVGLSFTFRYTNQNKPTLAHRDTSLLFLNGE